MRESMISENDYDILFCLVSKVHTDVPVTFSTNLIPENLKPILNVRKVITWLNNFHSSPSRKLVFSNRICLTETVHYMIVSKRLKKE